MSHRAALLLLLLFAFAGCSASSVTPHQGDQSELDTQDGTSELPPSDLLDGQDGSTDLELDTLDVDGGDTDANDLDALDLDQLDLDTATATVVGARVDPAHRELTITMGERATTRFSFVLEYSDGTQRIVTPEQWTLEPTQLASITVDGLLTTSGISGGTVKLTAALGTRSAQATLALSLSAINLGPGLDPTAALLFPPQSSVTDSGPNLPNIVYPSAGTVFPAGIYPPVVQWRAPFETNPDALFAVRLQRSTAVDLLTITTGLGVADCPSSLGQGRCFQIPVEQWRSLAQAAAPESVSVTLYGRPNRNAADPAYASAPLNLKLVPGDLSGSVYYYHVTGNVGEIRRDDIASSGQPPSNTKVFTGESNCHGCHSLSRDGRRIVTEVASADWPDWRTAAVDVARAGNPADYIISPSNPATFRGQSYAFNPDGSKILASFYDYGGQEAHRLVLYDLADPANPTISSVGTGGHPAWSPDGGLVAYVEVNAVDGDLRIDYTQTNLRRMTVSVNPQGQPSFSTPELVLSGNGEALSWPSFSPDSRWMAFSRGVKARLTAHTDPPGQLPPYRNSLYIMRSNASGETSVVPMNRASVQLGASGERYDLQPVFSPFITQSANGGYYWLLFQSIRPYGVVLPDMGRHQLWVTAIRTDPDPGEDPSSPAWHLPGQGVQYNNVAGYWAPNPCGIERPHGASDACLLDSDCCEGYVCGANGTCEQVAEACRLQGQTCTNASECCGTDAVCIENSAGIKVCMPHFN